MTREHDRDAVAAPSRGRVRRRPERAAPPGRRAGQRRARHRRHDPEPRAAAPGDARHAAPRRAPRRRTRPRRRPGHRLHAPGLREAERVPHLPPDHDAHQPHRLAVELRQRGAVHRRRRADHGHRGPAAGRLHPDDPHRAVAHRHLHPVPRRDGPAGRRADSRVLRVPRPRARPQPDRGGDRRAVPPELQPHRRHQGGPPLGLDRRHPHRDGEDPRGLRHLRRPRARQRDLRRPDPVDRHHPGRAGGGVRRVGLEPPGIGRRLGPAARRPALPRVPRPRLPGVDAPRRRLVFALLGPAAGDPRSRR